MIQFLITQERVEKYIKVKEFIGMTHGNIEMSISAMSKFVLGPNGYMDEKEAYDMLSELTLEELKAALTDFSTKRDDAIVSPTSAA
jgi:hypothetical protein